jgi:hypothetical protein
MLLNHPVRGSNPRYPTIYYDDKRIFPDKRKQIEEYPYKVEVIQPVGVNTETSNFWLNEVNFEDMIVLENEKILGSTNRRVVYGFKDEQIATIFGLRFK